MTSPNDLGKQSEVLIVSLNFSPEVTGIAPYSTGLATQLSARYGAKVTVLAAHAHYPEWRIPRESRKWHETVVEGSVHVHRLLHYVPSRPTDLRRLVSEVTFALRILLTRWPSAEVVVVVTPSLIASFATVIRSRLSNKKVVVWLQDIYTVGLRERNSSSAKLAAGRLIEKIERWTIRKADRTVVIHERFKETLESELKVGQTNLHVVRNWSHIDTVGLDNLRDQTRRGYDAAEGDFVIAHAGAQGIKQGLDDVVRMIREEPRLKEVIWLFVGGGSENSHLKEISEGLDCIKYIEPQPETQFRELIASVDAFLLSESEGSAEAAVPSKLTTYFRAGHPVIAVVNEHSISAQEVSRSGAGIVVQRNAVSLAAAIGKLRSNRELAARFGEKGRAYSNQHLGLDESVEQFSRVLGSLTMCTQKSESQRSHKDSDI